MWVVQVQKHLVDLSKHYIHEIYALVSLDRAGCFAIEKQNAQKQLHSSSKIVSLRSQRFLGIQMYKINFVSRDLCTRYGPVCLYALRTLCTRCGPVCLRTLTLTLTHCLMTQWVEHYSALSTKIWLLQHEFEGPK